MATSSNIYNVAIIGPQTFALQAWESFLQEIAPHMQPHMSVETHPRTYWPVMERWTIAGPGGFLFLVQKHSDEEFGMWSPALSLSSVNLAYALFCAAIHVQQEHTEKMAD